MRWFKHDSCANRDAKLEKVLLKYGADGYAMYWLCLELIADLIDKEHVTFELEHDAETIGSRLKIDTLRAEEIMKYFITLQLFESDGTRITCLKLAARLENSIVKSPQIKEIQAVIRENPGLSRKIREKSGKVGPDIDIDIDIESDKDKDKDKDQNQTKSKSVHPVADEPAAPRPHSPKRFTKPTLEEIRAYCAERKNTILPEKFLDYYEANGWRVGRNPMKDWRAAVRNWEQNEKAGGKNASRPTGRKDPWDEPGYYENSGMREARGV